MINKRVFGSDISPKVKKKLEQRQKVAETSNPLESIDPEIIKTNFPTDNGSLADLSSRTPFARMWTNVALVESGSSETEGVSFDNKVDEKIYVIGTHNISNEYVPGVSVLDTDKEGSISVEDILPNPHKIKDDQNSFMKPMAGITNMTTETEGTLGVRTKTTINFIVPNFADFDEIYQRFFLKPGAQIFVDYGWDTSNLYDISDIPDNIEQMEKYFFNNPGESEDIGELGVVTENEGDMNTIVGIVTNYDSKINKDGSVECSLELTSKNSALLGFEYDGKESAFFTNISYILDHVLLYNFMIRSRKDIKIEADSGTFGANMGPQDTLTGAPDTNDSFDIYSNVDFTHTDPAVLVDETDFWEAAAPDSNSSMEEIEAFTKYLKAKASFILGDCNDKSYDPAITYSDCQKDGNFATIDTSSKNYQSLYYGVFYPNTDSDVYYSWGVIEDFVINNTFGFGIDELNINTGNNFQVRMDSSESFVSFDKSFLEKQRLLGLHMEPAPHVLFPSVWGGSPDGDLTADTYNTVRGKSPSEKNYTDLEVTEIVDEEEESTSEKRETKLEYDKKNNRMPLRELFVRSEIVKDGFAKKSMTEALQYILEEINKETHNLLDLKLVNNGNDSNISIIDRNFLNIEKGDTDEDTYKGLFEFNVTSGKSIVLDYDISFSMPDGNIGSMYAIQGLAGQKMNPINKIIDEQLALESIGQKYQDYYIKYLPDTGEGFRASRLEQDENQASKLGDLYNRVTDILNAEDYKLGVGDPYDYSPNLVTQSGMTSGQEVLDLVREIRNNPPIAETNKVGVSQKHDQVLENETNRLINEGHIITKTIGDYYKKIIGKVFNEKQRPTVLPLTLKLKIYGISSILPGDIFRVNYLPKVYKENVYFQVIKVTHNVDSTGWFTELETQFRIKPHKKIESNLYKKDSKVFLSTKSLEKTAIKEFDYKHSRVIKFKKLLEYITEINPVALNFNHPLPYIKAVYKFRINPNVTKDIKIQFPYYGINQTQKDPTDYKKPADLGNLSPNDRLQGGRIYFGYGVVAAKQAGSDGPDDTAKDPGVLNSDVKNASSYNGYLPTYNSDASQYYYLLINRDGKSWAIADLGDEGFGYGWETYNCPLGFDTSTYPEKVPYYQQSGNGLKSEFYSPKKNLWNRFAVDTRKSNDDETSD